MHNRLLPLNPQQTAPRPAPRPAPGRKQRPGPRIYSLTFRPASIPWLELGFFAVMTLGLMVVGA